MKKSLIILNAKKRKLYSLIGILCILVAAFYTETYYYRFNKNNKYIDDIKLILILDKDAVIKSMGCRTTRKYSFDIMTKPILKKDIIELFEQHGWRSRSKYSSIKIKKGDVSMNFSNYPENTKKILITVGY